MKAKLKNDVTESSVEDFLKSEKDASRRVDCQQLVSIMSKLTGEKPKMWGPSMVGFGTYHYKYDSGREGEYFIMGFSPRKQNITVYALSGWDETELKQLGKHSTGKSCLYIKSLSDIKISLLEKLLADSLKKMSKQRIMPF